MRLIVVLAVFLAAGKAAADGAEKVSAGKGLSVDMRYASANNFMGMRLYPEGTACYLHPKAKGMLERAAAALYKENPRAELVILDCLRPVAVQKRMWQLVAGTDKEQYVAAPNPPNYSMHNRGCAIDLSMRLNGEALDMGTPFDYFGEKAQPKAEDKLLESGDLTAEQVKNRRWLRRIMKDAGFRVLSIEWWHFSCTSKKSARRMPVYESFEALK